MSYRSQYSISVGTSSFRSDSSHEGCADCKDRSDGFRVPNASIILCTLLFRSDIQYEAVVFSFQTRMSGRGDNLP